MARRARGGEGLPEPVPPPILAALQAEPEATQAFTPSKLENPTESIIFFNPQSFRLLTLLFGADGCELIEHNDEFFLKQAGAAEGSLLRVNTASTRMVAMLKELLNTGELWLGNYGLFSIMLIREEASARYVVKIKENLALGNQRISTNVRLLFPSALTFIECSMKGDVRGAYIDSNDPEDPSADVVILYQDGSEWRVTKDHPHFELFRQLGKGESVPIGKVISKPVYFVPGVGFIEGGSSRLLNESSTLELEPMVLEAIQIYQNVISYQHHRVEFDIVVAGRAKTAVEETLVLEMPNGNSVTIDVLANHVWANPLLNLLEGSRIRAGLTTNGEVTYFNARSGVMSMTPDRLPPTMPWNMKRHPVLGQLETGVFYHPLPDRKHPGELKGFIYIAEGGHEKFFKANNPVAFVLSHLTQGCACYINGSALGEAGVDENQVYALMMTHKGLEVAATTLEVLREQYENKLICLDHLDQAEKELPREEVSAHKPANHRAHKGHVAAQHQESKKQRNKDRKKRRQLGVKHYQSRGAH